MTYTGRPIFPMDELRRLADDGLSRVRPPAILLDQGYATSTGDFYHLTDAGLHVIALQNELAHCRKLLEVME